MMAPESGVNLKVFRNGAERELAVKLGELPTTEAAVERRRGDSSSSSLSGVSVQDLDARTSRELGLPANSQGVVVTDVSPSSAAAEAGLERGDVVQEVNHKAVRNTSDFERLIAGSKDQALLLVNRNGNTMYLAV